VDKIADGFDSSWRENPPSHHECARGVVRRSPIANVARHEEQQNGAGHEGGATPSLAELRDQTESEQSKDAKDNHLRRVGPKGSRIAEELLR
jgi:hypothetical protein